jgi:hypothetical protein
MHKGEKCFYLYYLLLKIKESLYDHRAIRLCIPPLFPTTNFGFLCRPCRINGKGIINSYQKFLFCSASINTSIMLL